MSETLLSDDVAHILGATRDCSVCDGYGFKTNQKDCGGCDATGTVHSYPPNVRRVAEAMKEAALLLHMVRKDGPSVLFCNEADAFLARVEHGPKQEASE